MRRRENLTESECGDLTQMLEYLPALATLRRFTDRIYWLFDAPKDAQQAGCRRSAILRDPFFRAVPELVKAMEQLEEERFRKLTAYLRSPLGRRVRTNNHVERTNRMFRFLEKVRYRWRRRKTLVRFVVLTLDEIWRRWSPAEPETATAARPVKRAKTRAHERQRSRQVA